MKAAICFRILAAVAMISGLCPAVCAQSGNAPPDLSHGLIGHWPLAGHARDLSGHGRDAFVRGTVSLHAAGPRGVADTAAEFNGRDGWLEVPASVAPNPGKEDFSVSVWLHGSAAADDVPGDILSQYNPADRRGFHLSLRTSAVTSSLANAGHLHFGIDRDVSSDWSDCGRPGDSLLAFSLAVHEGRLYAGTCEPGAQQSGHVYRYEGGQQWTSCGSPDRSNTVTSLAVHDGCLFAATGKYRVAGSALPESENTQLGGRVFRYAGDDQWIDCGQLPETEAVGGMTVFQGQLYATSLYRPAGFFRYLGGNQWQALETPGGKRVDALAPWNGHLYAGSYDGGNVYRWDGTHWTDCGRLGESTQTYSFAVYEGRLYVGTWPQGRVYRFEDVGNWSDAGRLGEELEVMGMLVHNGRLTAGTLPLAEVYSYTGNSAWTRLTRLDHTPDVKYRRVWTMAEHDGRLFCSTLPSGRIYSYEAGRNVTWGHSLSPGWHHLAAVKSHDRLTLAIDGQIVARSEELDPAAFELDQSESLKIGFGANDYFCGRLSDLRLYARALSDREIRELASNR